MCEKYIKNGRCPEREKYIKYTTAVAKERFEEFSKWKANLKGHAGSEKFVFK